MRSAHGILLLALSALMNTPRAPAGEFTRSTRALTEVPAPPQGQSEWVARSMRMNGLPMTLKSFRSRLTPDALCQYYEAMGNRQHVAIQRLRRGEWLVLSMNARDELITVQARQTLEGSEGTITVSPALTTVHLTIDTAFPHPATASIVNLQEYDDEGSEAEHISLASARSVAVETQAFIDRLQRDGWQARRRSTRAGGGQVIEAQKGAQHALLNLMRNHAAPGTAIVVVWRKS